ncbi:hypothetical protein NEF87_004906 [Candidatus Lokiarchaeum ossiferum]|uniref:Uncharacterized protein n=1 Tax=Candidatus Lokiarchaeum ossiferum TaxID=2951803 RepID=A0ABY6HZ47_9ARCH|nr:hypothetical protein NEF87_004906 [Candidatus Lokiarchaeum sp. B-35]
MDDDTLPIGLHFKMEDSTIDEIKESFPNEIIFYDVDEKNSTEMMQKMNLALFTAAGTAMIIGVTTISVIAVLVVKYHFNKGKGVVIDTRTIPPTISEMGNVAQGTMVIVNKDGTQTKHVQGDQSDASFIGVLKEILKQIFTKKKKS